MRLIILFALAALGCTGCSPTQLKCQPLMANSQLRKNLRILVPAADGDAFNRKVVAYLATNDFSYETSTSDEYLSPPDASGRQARFKNIKTIGCTNGVIVWSENVSHPDEYIVTIHQTLFSDGGQATRIAEGLKAAVGANPRH